MHYLKNELYQLVREDPRIFDFLQAGSLDGVWYWDLQNPEHEWMSERFWETFGHDPEAREHLASEWQDMIHPEDLQVALKNFELHCEDPNHPYDQTVRYRHRDGGWTWVRCRGLAVRDEAGNPVRMLGAHTDVTELKSKEEALAQRTAQLERSNRELEQFASIAAHDLKEPLKSISSFAWLLEEEFAAELDERGLTYVKFIKEGVGRMSQMVTDLLEVSRVVSDQIAPSWLDVESICSDLLQEVWPAEEAPCRVGELPQVWADESQLRRSLLNLLTNARKFASPERPLQVEIRGSTSDDGATSLEVEDNGLGIADAEQEKIFEMFTRLRTDQKGSGIGLAVVQRVAERHGGRVEVESTLGAGSTFRLVFPGPP